MDQLKVILGHVRKHHFWLLCVICIVSGFVAWWMAAGSLSKDYASRKGAIDGKFSSLTTILSEPNFPNDQWRQAAEELTEQQKAKVRTAWQQVYDEQAPHLKWPEALGSDFHKIRSQSQADSLSPQSREQYMTYIHREFPKLLDIIGADRSGKKEIAPDASAAMSQTKVIWDPGNQSAIEKSLRFPIQPSALEVWLAQEDLWVYHVLLTIFKNVNADRYVPPLKEIKRMVIAQDAAKEFERGLKSGIIELPSNMPENAGGDGGGADVAMASPEMAGGQAPPPDTGRYLDADGKPMAAGTSEQGPFKRMPIYLELVIDEREIPKLLVECANSPLPVEVRKLRVNPDAGSKSSSSRERQGTEVVGLAESGGSYDVPVEISGIIYIYNPPDTAKLGSGEAPADGAAAPAGVTGQ